MIKYSFTRADRFPLSKINYIEMNRTIEEKSNSYFNILDKVYNERMKERLYNVKQIRKENIEMIKLKENKIIRDNVEVSPGPGAYEVNRDLVDEKAPFVN